MKVQYPVIKEEDKEAYASWLITVAQRLTELPEDPEKRELFDSQDGDKRTAADIVACAYTLLTNKPITI